MKVMKKILSAILAFAIIVSALPILAFADEDADEFRISNGYLSFSYNQKTGGFAIETAEGNPQKLLDNNIPLLYSEDKDRSNGTSFITVKIDDKEYIFGQDYGFFKLKSSLGTVEVKENGRLLEIPWTIEGVKVTLKAALDTNIESSTTGNVGLSFDVENNTGENKNISVRLLLDTALGNRIDAPYFVVDTKTKATLTETEFSDDNEECENVPQQIRAVDSLTNPTRLSYILTQGWDFGVKPNKVILGHWANLANTRYEYDADEYCDFTNYSNDYREPDSAAAIYWENNALASGESFVGELLYGVGNFSKSTGYPMGINITTERVELAADKKSYKNDGDIKVTVEIDNTVDNASQLSNVLVNLVTDDDKIYIPDGSKQVQYLTLGKEIKTLQYTLKALPQNDLCAGTIFVSVSGTKVKDDGTDETFETAAERSIVLPSVGDVSEVQLNKVNPEIVYTEGEKAITISGKMKALSAALANDAKADLKLVHEKTGDEVVISKDKIAFLDETCETLTFTTNATLTVGNYNIVFDIKDDAIKENLKFDSITCNQKLQVSADSKYKLKSYGMIALVRTTKGDDSDYDFYTFGTEYEFLKFYNGDASAKGETGGKTIKYDFGKNEKAITEHEILLTVRANLREMQDAETKEVFWQADYADSDIIINNMLSYEGDTPLKIYKTSNEYKIEGDGLLKVVNSINVWRSKWSISAEKGDVYTLDSERYKEAFENTGKTVETEEVTLAFSGAATMIQSLGGFAVDLKYGVLSSQWYDNSDGMVTYGIGFGGSISLPIKAKKDNGKSKTDNDESGSSSGGNEGFNVVTTEAFANPSDAANRESDLEGYLTEHYGAYIAQQYMSGEITREVESVLGPSGSGSEPSTPSAPSSSSVQSPNVVETSSTGDKMKKDDNLPEGSLSAEVDNVLFGEKGSVKDGVVQVNDTGFVGIDATFSVVLPEDLLGSFVSNAPGLSASVTINTIKNQYEINAGLNIKLIECEGILAFKQVNVKNKDVILPDKIEFYIREGLKLPIAAPQLFMTGLGGGINGLADTIGGEFDKLPPITILLYTRLEAIGILDGEFNAKLSLEGMSLDGDMKLNAKGMEKVMKINAGISARWVEPWEISLYGNVNIIDGLIKGGITVTIADNYFYGYVFANICIPDSIPIVGGKILSGIEAAVSHEFIGANISIIGIKFGVIYYWGDKISFGGNIDLSAPPRDNQTYEGIASDISAENAVGYYGTNIHPLKTVMLVTGASVDDSYKETKVNVNNAEGQNALLVEIPYYGSEPKIDEIYLYNPKGKPIALIADDGKGGGNMLVQNRDDGDYIYVTVTDPSLIENGAWTIKYPKDSGFEIYSANMNGVDDIPALAEDKTRISLGTTNADKITNVNIGWKVNGAKSGQKGTLDIYLTEDKDILTKIKTSQNNGDILGTNIYHNETADLETIGDKVTVDLPDSLPSGKYYAVTTLSTADGISLAISPTYAEFTNQKLPMDVDKVEVLYGGNGEIFVKVTDPKDADYTHYLAEITAEDGTVLENNIGQFEKGVPFTFGKDVLLKSGKQYRVKVKTLKEEYKKSDGEYKTHYYYGMGVKASEPLTMPEPDIPKLKSVKVNFDTSADEINTNVKDVIIEYEFEQDVFMELDLNGSKVYAFGKSTDFSDSATYFKKNWKFVLDDLEDGDYVVDFTAFSHNKENNSKDHISGSQITDVANAYFGFTVDTSAPVLSLAQKSVAKDDITVVFGANTVTADENGKYTIEGMTETSAKLTIDGEEINADTQGFKIAANGSFSIEKTLPENEAFKSHTITATDKARNTSEMMVWAVKKDGFSFDDLELYIDGKAITPNADGVKNITLKNGQSAKLSAFASANGKKFAIDNDLINWSVMYAKNALVITGNNITALSPAESAIKAKLTTGSVVSGKNIREEGVSDYVVVNVANNSKSDLAEKITEAENFIAGSDEVSEEKKNDLQAAVDEAKAVLNNSSATESDYTDAVTRLIEAIGRFKHNESSSSHSGGGGGSYARYSVTTKKAEHGTIKLSQNTVVKGNSLTIAAVPDEGYTVADMIINGVSVGRREVYTINSVKENIVVEVIFAEMSDLPFEDVIESDWFYAYVKNAYENRYMLGTSDTIFEPETVLTRAMFVTILHRIDGEKQERDIAFVDVAADAYYRNAVAWANKNGIVLGTSDTEFAPDENITREQMAAILYRYAQYKNMDISICEDTNILSYKDYTEISEYAIKAMQYTAGTKLITGKTETTLNPQDNATRAEAATVFVRFAEMLK